MSMTSLKITPNEVEKLLNEIFLLKNDVSVDCYTYTKIVVIKHFSILIAFLSLPSELSLRFSSSIAVAPQVLRNISLRVTARKRSAKRSPGMNRRNGLRLAYLFTSDSVSRWKSTGAAGKNKLGRIRA